MTRVPLPDDERILNLLTARAANGLSAEEEAELHGFLGQHPEIDAAAFDHAAAAVDLALATALEEPATGPLPAELRSRVLSAAHDHFARRGADRTDSAIAEDTDAAAERMGLPPLRSQVPGESLGDIIAPRGGGRPQGDVLRLPSSRGGSAAWLAAAAALLLAVAGWWRALTPAPASLSPPIAQPAGPTVRERFEQFVQAETDLIRAPFAGQQDAFKGVRGEVVWSDRKQAGYMKLVGLPANDASKAQYQLWIVDPARDKNPVDGGVFDVPAGAAEAIIPIDSKLTVRQPKAFAITREQPGGVVVSAGPLLVVAAVEQKAG